MDVDSQVIRERYPGTVSDRENEEDEEWREMSLSWKELPKVYLKLSKSRLTSVSYCVCVVTPPILLSFALPALVVLTAVGGYSMAPGPLDIGVLLWTAAGTALCSAAANSFNQVPTVCIGHRCTNHIH